MVGRRDGLWDVTKPPRLFSGGGGLVSTAADYLRFCQMLLSADSDEAGHAFQIESGHPFRFEAGHRSDLKSATVAAFRRVEKMLFLFLDLGQAG
jgi:CubicO group peptidase (beta-lactamase class C family)